MALGRCVGVVLVLVLAGCQTFPPMAPALAPVELTAAQVELVKKGVASGLKDPESARFDSGFKAGRDDSSAIFVCGYVNAKNSFGGYTGAKPFIAGLTETAAVLVGVGGTDIESQVVMQRCAEQGMAI